MKIYLDNAATTPLDKEVLNAMLPYMENHFGNPSSIHGFGRQTRAAIEKARKTVADCLNASTSEIFFTSCGTESDNMILTCAVKDYGIKHIVTSRIEHHAVLHPVENHEKRGTAEVHYVNITDNGHIDLDHLDYMLGEIEDRCLVSLMHANNEIGNLLDLDRAAEICEKHNALLHSDTVQTMAHFPIDLQKTKAHFITGSAHKFHGPKGIGFIYINSNLKICPYISGGAQERNMRAGTENVYGIIGLAKAMEIAVGHMDEHAKYIRGLKDYMIEGLKRVVPDIRFNGDIGPRSLYTVLSVMFPPSKKTDMIIYNLDFDGIAVSGGSACSSGSSVGSHVLNELSNVPGEGWKQVRFSFSKFNTKEELDYVLEKIGAYFMVEANVKA